MKKSKALIFVVLLAVFTGIAAYMHLSTREVVPEHNVAVSYEGDTVYVDLDAISYEQVSGVRVNGKGEEKVVEGPGIALKELLTANKMEDYTKAAIISDDSYQAEVTAEEIAEDGKVVLMYEEEELRLVVFGDKDSKRSVSNVVKIEVE